MVFSTLQCSKLPTYQRYFKKKLAELGYTQIEGFGGLYDQAAELRQDLDRNGLTMPTGHFGFDMLNNQVDDAMRIIETLGVETVICPYLALELCLADVEGWKKMADILNEAGKPYLDNGVGFG